MTSSLKVSANFNDRPAGLPVDMLVLHYTGMRTCAEALARLCDVKAAVSTHYLIEEDGTVHRLVDEDKRAWHAGAAWWRGAMDVNGRSVGIELVNPGHEFGYRPFPKAQMLALTNLAKSILMRHPIPPRNVVGHSDVAPRRKRDPGERFDWRHLAVAGVGLWVDQAPSLTASEDQVRALLAAFGYEVADLTATVMAFQRHFRPTDVTGVADGATVGVLKALLDHS